MIAFTRDDIRRKVGEAAFRKAQAYYADGLAVVTDLSPDGTKIVGTVQGTGKRPYGVTVRLAQQGKTLRIDDRCTCPVGFSCKHAAALLLQVLGERQGSLTLLQSPESAGSPPVPSKPTATPAVTLSREVAEWLVAFEKVERSESEDYPPELRQRLIYVLDVGSLWNGARCLMVSPVSVRLLKDGGFSHNISVYEAEGVVAGRAAQYLRPSDHAILRPLARTSSARRPGDAYPLKGTEGAEVLEAILATGRCRWQTLDGPALTKGEPRPSSIIWVLGEDGRLRADLAMDDTAVALPVVPPWYVDTGTGVCGLAETGLAPAKAAGLLAAPPLTAGEASVVRERLVQRFPAGDVPPPPQLTAARVVSGPPVPRLLLYRKMLKVSHSWMPYRPGNARLTPGTTVPVALVRLSFYYDDIEIRASDPRSVPTSARNGLISEVTRDAGQERKVMGWLRSFGFGDVRSTLYSFEVPADCAEDLTLRGEDSDWLEFLLEDVPQLRANGWIVDVADDFPFRLAEFDGELEADLQPEAGSGIDWFDLSLGAVVDGTRVDLLPALLGVIRTADADLLSDMLNDGIEDGGFLHVRLEDGRILPLPFDRIRPILAALLDFMAGGDEVTNGRVRISRAQAAEAAALEQATANSGVKWRGAESLREMGRRLTGASGIPEVPMPTLFQGTLRPYQRRGLDWMQFLRDVGLGGVLADDMGLGKTVQALAHIATEKESGRMDAPCLVVAPTSLMANWRMEAAAFTPSLKVLVLHGSERKEAFGSIAGFDLVLTTYPLLSRDAVVLMEQHWHLLILDEAQNVKNPETTAAKTLRQLQAAHRLCLTGTPLENHLGELWALFDFLSPGFLGTRQHFTRQWRTPIEKKGDDDRRRLLARRVRPFLLRRAKSEVASELPPKTEIIEHVELGGPQRDLYEGIRLTMNKKLADAIAAKGLSRIRIEFLDALLKLRQACCDPRLVKSASAKVAKAGSAKLVRLMEMLPELISEGRRILLFSQFTSMLALIEAELKAAEIPYVILTGDTRDRETPVRRFQAEEVPLFLISLKAGGTGLNLTAADTVIHYDPWWNPAVEAQATDRAHRIGQDKRVFVHKMITLSSIEEKMVELQSRKRELAAGLFDPEGGSALDIGVDDVAYLLGEG